MPISEQRELLRGHRARNPQRRIPDRRLPHPAHAERREIRGGTFILSNGTTTVAGGFARGGTVTYVTTFVTGSFCIQKFAVSGDLLPSGHFAGKLLHYGSGTASSCNVFFATISGGAELTFR